MLPRDLFTQTALYTIIFLVQGSQQSSPSILKDGGANFGGSSRSQDCSDDESVRSGTAGPSLDGFSLSPFQFASPFDLSKFDFFHHKPSFSVLHKRKRNFRERAESFDFEEGNEIYFEDDEGEEKGDSTKRPCIVNDSDSGNSSGQVTARLIEEEIAAIEEAATVFDELNVLHIAAAIEGEGVEGISSLIQTPQDEFEQADRIAAFLSVENLAHSFDPTDEEEILEESPFEFRSLNDSRAEIVISRSTRPFSAFQEDEDDAGFNGIALSLESDEQLADRSPSGPQAISSPFISSTANRIIRLAVPPKRISPHMDLASLSPHNPVSPSNTIDENGGLDEHDEKEDPEVAALFEGFIFCKIDT